MRNHYNAIFLMCANKVKENKTAWHLCPFSFKKFRVFGILTPSTLLVLNCEVGRWTNHMNAILVQGWSRHPPLFTVSYWVSKIPVLKSHLQEHDCSRQWKVLKQILIKNFNKHSSQCSLAQQKLKTIYQALLCGIWIASEANPVLSIFSN